MRNKILPYNPRLKELARHLRKNSTLPEVLFWKAIKGKSMGVEFHRQVPINEYIVDFFCHELRLAVEIDGSIHWEKEVAENDILRQQKLESMGVCFVRFDNRSILKNLPEAIEFLAGKIAEMKNDLGMD